MSRFYFCLLAAWTGLAGESKWTYPPAHKVEQVDDYHGKKVADPYRWLENADSPETRQWIEAQNKLTFGFLEKIPERDKIKARLTELWNFERYGVPYKEGGLYFVSKNDGLQNQSVLYKMAGLDRPMQMLLDPNQLTADGTVSLRGTAVSEDGKWLAYGLSTAGSDWQEWKVRDISSARDASDQLQWVKFSNASWSHDSKGFFYSRYDAPAAGAKLQGVNYFQKLYYHRQGAPQSEDILVYHRPDQKEWGFQGFVTEDGQYLIIDIWKGSETKNRLFYKEIGKDFDPKRIAFEGGKVVELLDKMDASYNFVSNDGPLFWFRTDLQAPKGKIILIDIRKPEPEHWQTVLPEMEETLESVSLVNDQFIAVYMKDATSLVKIFDRSGKHLRSLDLPGIGTASGFTGKRLDHETFYSFTSFTRPPTIYRHDMRTGRSSVFREPALRFNPEDYISKQVFFRSKDGTRVPMFVTHKKGVKLDGTNRTLLYGYGGFNISLTPAFSPAILVWMEMGGVYAQPTLRGGGEYGEEWHQAGMKLKKQNVFDDFIAAAEYLIAEKYTSSSRLAISGGSNGGLLVGACMTQRPELFGAALPAVGVMDMLRFHKFTIGWGWVSDYGSADDPEQFKALYAYSPLHNLKKGARYPATLVTTADHDDRVVPAHSFKFAAALQEAQAGPAPVLIRIETKAGHGAGKPTSKIIEEAADRYAFLFANLK